MDDQNTTKPQLSLEEELDVLEAVWKVGREKGLDLLRPEQKKKLIDSGRINKDNEIGNRENKTSKKNISVMVDVFMYALKKSIENQMIEIDKRFSREEWEEKSVELKNTILDMFLYLYMGVKEKNLRQRMTTIFTGGSTHA